MITVTVAGDFAIADVLDETLDQAIEETLAELQSDVLRLAGRRSAALRDYLGENLTELADTGLAFPAGNVPTDAVIGPRIRQRQAPRRRPTRVRAHTRRIPSGRTVPVRAHIRNSQPPIEFLRQPLPGQIWVRRRRDGGRLSAFRFDRQPAEVDITDAVLRLIDAATVL